MNLKEALKEKLDKKELNKIISSFDIIGDIAVLEIPDELKPKEKEIAKALIKIHKHVKTVCKKFSERSGDFRLRKIETIIGKNTETIHKEYGCNLKLDVKKVYFSPRESTERQRISNQVKPNETILVMFAGIGPFAIAIAKKHPDSEIHAIEINPRACEYMKENIRLNRTYNVNTICGDVKVKAREFFGKCDRVLMPLPLEAHKYLQLAIKCLKPKGVIHLYHVAPKENLFEEALKIIEKEAKKSGRRTKVLAKKKVLPYGPGTYKVCVDFMVY